MEIAVSSRNVEVSASLKASVIDKIGRLDRFVDGMVRAEVHFAEERNPRIENKETCEVTLQGNGHYVRAKVAAADPFAAVDAAVAKLEHQLLKLKSRLVSRYHGKVNAAKPRVRAVTAGGEEGEEVLAEAAPVEPVTAAGPEPEPRLVKRKHFALKRMSLDDAMLQMDLLSHRFFVFLQEESGVPAVLYQREDGDLGLIEITS